MDDKKPVVGPALDAEAEAEQMAARMMWGIKRGVGRSDVATLRLLRDMNRKERRRYLARQGKRVRKG